MKTSIGIIGQGFVGSAIREGLKSNFDIRAYDIQPSKCYGISDSSGCEEVIWHSDIIFFCLPTPMRQSGECDLRILEEALDDAYNAVKKINPDPRHSDFLDKLSEKKTFVIKSTVPPGTTDRMAARYPRVNVCFSPEFLTEANFLEDFKNQTRIIIGGDGAKNLKMVFRKAFPSIPIVLTKPTTAEMVKYFTNCFLATKVTFANVMYELCQLQGIDYDKVCEYVLYDDRIGKSHLAVPGPDGFLGFGGHCFPKDLNAMISIAGETLQNTRTEYFLRSVKATNDMYRTNKDWEKMKGRAVSDD